jgi:prepilin-type N-terminal cleavage/methylation domain-containing protein
MKRNNRRAFTIVELVIVIAVIAVLAAVLVPAFGDVIDKAKDGKALQEAKNAYTQYMIDHAAEAVAAEYMFYDADGRWVALYNGTAVGVYQSADDALGTMGLDPLEGLTDLGGGLYAYGGSVEVPVEPIAPVEPAQPDPPADAAVEETDRTPAAGFSGFSNPSGFHSIIRRRHVTEADSRSRKRPARRMSISLPSRKIRV